VSNGGGGVNTSDVKWAIGELEWSTLMIVLDRAVGSLPMIVLTRWNLLLSEKIDDRMR
jgi:hypothetical protein